MKKSRIITDSRRKAMSWWNKLDLFDKKYIIKANKNLITGQLRQPHTLTGREIENIHTHTQRNTNSSSIMGI
jgi:hypothetical protein